MSHAPIVGQMLEAWSKGLGTKPSFAWPDAAVPVLPARPEPQREVWPDLDKALRRWPLPRELDDTTLLNRTQVAEAFQVSENTITKWIGDGMPVEVEGGNGVPYQFRLSHCFAWKMDRDERARAERARGDALARQAALSFLNPDADDDVPQGMTASELRAWAEAEYHRNRVDEQRGDLVRVARVREGIEGLLSSVRSFFLNLPDWAEAEFALTPEQTAKLQDRCDATLRDLRGEIERQCLPEGRVVGIGAARQASLDL